MESLQFRDMLTSAGLRGGFVSCCFTLDVTLHVTLVVDKRCSRERQSRIYIPGDLGGMMLMDGKLGTWRWRCKEGHVPSRGAAHDFPGSKSWDVTGARCTTAWTLGLGASRETH